MTKTELQIRVCIGIFVVWFVAGVAGYITKDYVVFYAANVLALGAAGWLFHGFVKNGNGKGH